MPYKSELHELFPSPQTLQRLSREADHSGWNILAIPSRMTKSLVYQSVLSKSVAVEISRRGVSKKIPRRKALPKFAQYSPPGENVHNFVNSIGECSGRFEERTAGMEVTKRELNEACSNALEANRLSSIHLHRSFGHYIHPVPTLCIPVSIGFRLLSTSSLRRSYNSIGTCLYCATRKLVRGP